MVLSEQTPVFKINNLTFILYGKDIIIKTPLQAFYLCSNYYWETGFYNCKMNEIRSMIPIGRIKTLNDLARQTRPGIKWTSTAVIYDTSKCDIKVL